jgi:hypothetical protein
MWAREAPNVAAVDMIGANSPAHPRRSRVDPLTGIAFGYYFEQFEEETQLFGVPTDTAGTW